MGASVKEDASANKLGELTKPHCDRLASLGREIAAMLEIPRLALYVSHVHTRRMGNKSA